MSLIRRRRAEIDAKLASLGAEFEYWRKITLAEGGLGRHNSQVRRLAATIDGALATLRATLKELPGDSERVLDEGEEWENEILAAHSIWEVFRSKLVLRHNQLFADKLAACDDLAWECYSPALQQWDPERKGPPLVYFSATWSPFAMSRDSSFQNEVKVSMGTKAALRDEGFQAVLGQLPVPLVSIPWYHAFHLPGALIIAHEVGHVVEDDFGLRKEIETAIEGAGLKFTDLWLEWSREMFADVYGCCAMGPAFAGAMIDLNATNVKKVQQEERKYGDYPTYNLRVRLLSETLRQTGHAGDAARLLANWEAVYGPIATMLDYLAELPKVVEALLKGPYRGKALTEIVSYPAGWDNDVPVIGRTAAQNMSLKGRTDPRPLFAAVQWLHENAHEAPNMARAQENLVRQIISKSAQVVRFDDPQTRANAEAKLAALEGADRARGAELRKTLLRPWPAEGPPREGAQQGRRGS